MLVKKNLSLLFCLFFFANAIAQISSVSGTVIGVDNIAISGVTVQQKNKKIATKTNNDGTFILKVVPTDKLILIFSSIGFETQEITIKSNEKITVKLKIANSVLDDVVVVGYGTQKRKDVTGSVAKVNITDLQKAPVRSFEEALAGRIAGVTVASADGQPGAASAIVIRGGNSITQDNSPLYVVDGFPIENPNSNSINPNDIESIEILKDASATAIYGARGANGVIMITTKKGTSGKTKFSVNSSYGTQNIINKVNVLNAYEFVKYQFELDSLNTKSQYLTAGKTIESYINAKSIDWQEQVFRQAPMINNSFSISGGNNDTKFFLSMSALKQDGIVKFSGYDRYQARLRFDHNINSKTRMGMNLNYSGLKSYGTIPSSLTNSSSQSSNLMFSVWGYRPNSGDTTVDLLDGIDPLFEADPNDSRFNPLETVSYELRNRFSNTIFGNAFFEYDIFKNLKFKTFIGITNDIDRNEEFNGTKTRAGSPNTVGGRTNGINGSYVYNTSNSYVNENTLSFDKKINDKNSLNAVAGFTFQGVSKYIYGAAAAKLPNERLGLSGLDEGTPTKVSSLRTSNTTASFLARVNYNFDNRYLATVSFRADGSSKFSPDNKWSYFPSASIAWRVSQEKFLQNVKWINDFKIRTSYGLTGNNKVSDFAYLTTLSSPIILAYPFNNTATSSTLPNTLGNPNLRWETTKQVDLGLDLSLLKNRLSFTVDLYKKVTKDLLLNADLPPSSGFSSAFKNIGSLENKGIELSITGKIIDQKKWKWTSSFNIGFNQNRIINLNDGQESRLSTINWDNQWRDLPAYIAKVGQPVGQMYGFIWDGLYQYNDFDKTPTGVYTLKPNITSNTTVASNKIQPGHIKYKDLNGDFVINDNDKTIIGNGTPKFTGGFTNNISFGNFDLSLFFQFSYGGQILNANKYVFEGNSGRRLQNQYATVLNRWTPDNQNNEMFVANGDGPKQAYSSRGIEDGSYLRLKTFQFGYNLPAKTIKKLSLTNARFYISAQNIITWTNYSGFDPEVSAYNSALTPGFDYSVYPRAKTVTVGINLNF